MADSPPSRPKRFWPTYFVWRNFSNASAALSRDRIQRCSSARHRRRHTFDVFLDPALLVGLLDVHVLDADRAAVRVAQHAENVAQRHGFVAGEPVGVELAVEVPHREAVRRRVELGVHVRLFRRQRIEVGDQVAAHAIHVDERVDVHLLGEPGALLVDRVRVAPPAHRLVRHAHRAEDVVVEALLAEEELVHPLQELAGLRALDDAVVVGRRDRDDLAHAELGERLRIGRLVLGRVVDARRRRRSRPGRA